MLEWYQNTIIIYCAIILAEAVLFSPFVRANGWVKESNEHHFFSAFFKIILISLIPVFRLIIVIAFIYMSIVKRED